MIARKTQVNRFALINNASLENPAVVERIEALYPAASPWELAVHTWRQSAASLALPKPL